VKDAIAEAIYLDEVIVSAMPSGKRGMKVTISIPASDAKQTAELQAALEGYLFEFEIVQSAPPAGMPS
jgi:hypothetical protein